MECLDFSVIDLGELTMKFVDQRIPVKGGMEITHRCNLGCVHCYCRLSPGDVAARRAELTVDEIRDLARQFAEEGCLFMCITGGEPLVRKDFLEVYDSIRDRGILVTLFTNATLVTPEIADHLAERPPLSVEISLYGATEAVYESITSVPGSYARCRRGIELLTERGIKVSLKTPLMSLNKHEEDAMQEMADGLGLKYRYGGELTPRFEGMPDRMGPYRYALSLEEEVQLSLRGEERVEAWKEYLARSSGQPRPPSLFNCGAANHSFFVDPYGKLLICSSVREPGYDLRSGTFRQGWEEFLFDLRYNTMVDPDSKCQSCGIYPLCRQCPGRSQSEYGTGVLDRIVENHCRLAHMRAEAFVAAGIFEPVEARKKNVERR